MFKSNIQSQYCLQSLIKYAINNDVIKDAIKNYSITFAMTNDTFKYTIIGFHFH